MSEEHKLIAVGLDCLERPVCLAFVGAERWNGFLVPRVDQANFQEFERCLPKLKAEGVDLAAEVKGLKSEVITYRGKQIMVWNIGLGLMWQAQEAAA